jgi:ATP-dependent helicase/nuclease subunit A
LETLYQSVNTLVYLVEFIFNSDVCGEIMRLLDLFDSEVQDAKRSSGILTFKDVSDLAMDILQKHDEIRHIEQGRFDKIMIDEFQDNNARQCDALFMLSDERERFDSDGKYVIPNFDSASEDYIQKRLNPEKLFFVGDEKQGIYRFRGADVTVFRNLQTHLRGEKFSDGKKLHLS